MEELRAACQEIDPTLRLEQLRDALAAGLSHVCAWERQSTAASARQDSMDVDVVQVLPTSHFLSISPVHLHQTLPLGLGGVFVQSHADPSPHWPWDNDIDA